ncbi:hypothetical protein Leryth_016975 [Lithospermum erythrorhizon]|nr:hypothetical protein Leryth_016975 [Lithospermum erythrorhizon]
MATISLTACSSILQFRKPMTLLTSSNSISVSYKHLNSPPKSLNLRPRTLHLVKAKKQTFSSFEDLLDNSDKPVLVDFYATWCGPCQLMVPILNEVGESLQDKIKIVKIDTEKYPAIANKYNIQALPTFIVFKDGEPCDRFEGALPADQLVKRIDAALEAKQ